MPNKHQQDSQDQVQTLYRAAFDKPRDPRSNAYKSGALAALRFRCNGVRVVCPYHVATAEADAFHAGCDEGHAIFRAAQGRDTDQVVPLPTTFTAPVRELLFSAERYGSEYDSLPADKTLNHLRTTIVIAKCQAESAVIALHVAGTSAASEAPFVTDWLNRLRVDFNSIAVDARRLLDRVEKQNAAARKH